MRSLAMLTNTTQVPSYWRFDAMTSYKITNNITAQINIYNLTNEYYYAQVYSNWAVPGTGPLSGPDRASTLVNPPASTAPVAAGPAAAGASF